MNNYPTHIDYSIQPLLSNKYRLTGSQYSHPMSNKFFILINCILFNIQKMLIFLDEYNITE